MRVVGVRVKEVFQNVADLAIAGANAVMDGVCAESKRRCPTREGVTIGTVYRGYGTVMRDVMFTPKTGRGRGKHVNFIAKTETGRTAGSLRSTVRKVERNSRPGNIRCYAGNAKIFYARFIEYGTASTGWGKGVKRQSFMRPAFLAIKGTAQARIEEEMRKEPEMR